MQNRSPVSLEHLGGLLEPLAVRSKNRCCRSLLRRLSVFSGSVAILAQAIADNIGHHNSPRPEELCVIRLLVGGTTFPMRSRRERRADRKAPATAPSEPHEVVAPPPAKAAADGLSPHPANASFVPRRVVVTRPATNALANASSSSLVAGATTLPAKSPYPATAFAKPRPFVVPPVAVAPARLAGSLRSPPLVRALTNESFTVLPSPAGESRACEVASLSPAADEPPRKEARLESSLLTPADRRENHLSDDDAVDDAELLS